MDHSYLNRRWNECYIKEINFLNLRDPEIICNTFTQINKIYVILNVCVDTVNEFTLRMCKINRSRCFSKRLVSKEVIEVSTCFCWFIYYEILMILRNVSPLHLNFIRVFYT